MVVFLLISAAFLKIHHRIYRICIGLFIADSQAYGIGLQLLESWNGGNLHNLCLWNDHFPSACIQSCSGLQDNGHVICRYHVKPVYHSASIQYTIQKAAFVIEIFLFTLKILGSQQLSIKIMIPFK